MQTSFVRSFLIALAMALAIAISPTAHAQGLVSSGISGSLLDNGGKAIAGATVTAIHVPTNTTYTAVTTPAGRFKFSGLRIGGPYTLSATATGYEVGTLPDVYVQLSQDTDVTLTAHSDVVQLEKFEVKADANALDAGATGAGTVLTNRGLNLQPTSNRSFADMMKTNPFVSIRAGQQVTALGMNSRYNSISIDGARQNDNFGLSATGLYSLKNPFSLDALENFSIDLTPYDVTQSGFAGASINAVSKSGTNEFHGSAYYYYTSYRWQGADIYGTNNGKRPSVFYDRVYGGTLGGPIIPDKLFFFVNYEKERNPSGGATNPGFKPDSTVLANLTSQFSALPGSPAFGSFGSAGQAVTEDEKKLIKLDWNITKDHRLTVRYSSTEGNQPSYPDYSTSGAPSSMPSISPTPTYTNGVTSLNSKSYTIAVKEKVWAGQLFSNWTPDLKTEFAFSKNHTTSLRSTPVNLPEIVLLGVPGNSTSTGAAVSSSTALLFGTDYSSMGNGVITTTKDYSGNATYSWRDFTFKAGADREESDFENLFRNGSYGRFVYNYTPGFDLANATPLAFVRNVSTTGFPGTDISKFNVTGIFGQAKWEPTQRFTLTAGLRYDRVGSPIAPTYNPAILTAFGVRNDATIDGTDLLAPRLSFNYALDADRKLQVRGGSGLFFGRSPWVWISNSYGNAGFGRFTRTITAAGQVPTLSQYLGGTYASTDPIYKFDPSNPLGTTTATTGGGDIAFMKPGLKLPTNLRSNIALDYKLPFSGSTVSLEYINTQVQQAIFYDQINLVPGGKGLDGRTYFRRYVSTSNTALVPLGTASVSGNTANTYNTSFNRAFRYGNTNVGGSDYLALSFDHPLDKNGWSYNVAYVRGHSTEAQPGGSSTASSQWAFNVVFNQNQVEQTRSDYEVRDRVMTTLTKEFNIMKRYKTTVSLFYDGHSGTPYSYVYPGDLNYDGNTQNDAVAVPTGASDARFDFSGLSPTQLATYLAYMQSTGLSRFAGGYAPRNSFIGPWQNRLDLHLSQEVKVVGPVKVEVFADFMNFGSWLSKDLFNYVETLGSPTNSNQLIAVGTNANTAAYTADGHIRINPTGLFNSDGSIATSSSSQFLPNNDYSRWRIQAGVRLKF